MRRQRVEDLRISLSPHVVDHDPFEAPFFAIATELTIVAVHLERILASGPRAFARHEMLRHHVGVKCRNIVADVDLKIARSMTGIQRSE